ncbi:hypothetical protein [Emticicia sp. SJ17W-69]|uniref:hypothetical protein n=1 Tax=Emticicia sp. SJ17W-69 TaxID=3421657 RepID=UPI003EBD7E0D
MSNLPSYISIVFTCTTLLTLWLFSRTVNYSKIALIIVILWAIFQSLMGISGFYSNLNSFPPRFLLLIAPAILLIIIIFNTNKGQAFIDQLSIEKITLIHIVRIPVEIVLLWLFLQKKIPQLMTFEGRNFDILAGITAPIVYYLVFVKQLMSKKMLLFWNFACLALLLNIVINALLSAPLPFQQFAFEQPNIAILYFPFNLLPSVVVPLVLFAHLVAIRRFLKK